MQDAPVGEPPTETALAAPGEAAAPAPAEPPAVSPSARWHLPLVAALAVVPYLVSIEGPFVFDDLHDIVDNQANHALWPPSWASSSRPAVALTFALSWVVGGGATWSFHLFNTLVHLANALVLRELVRRAVGLPLVPERIRQRGPSLATWTAALWAVHPLHTSVVAYVVHRYESFASLFYLLAVLSFVRANEAGARRAAWGAALGASALVCGWSKETAVTLPIALVLLDLTLVSGSLRRLRATAALHGVAVVATALALSHALRPRGASSSQGFALVELRPIDYARTQLGVVARYLRLVVWPSDLSIDYFDWPIARSLADVMPVGLVTIAALVSTAVALVRWPRLGLVCAWFFVLLVPTSTVLPLAGELVAERRLYLALVAPALLAALALQSAAAERQRLAPWVAASVVGVLFGATTLRNLVFRTEVALFADTVDARPANARARLGFGNALAAEGRIDLALAQARACIERDLTFLQCYQNAVVFSTRLGLRNPWEGDEPAAPANDPRQAEAKAKVEAAKRALAEGRPDDAAAGLREAAQLHPRLAEAHARLSRILVLDPDPARRQAAEAVRASARAWALQGGAVGPSNATSLAAGLAELGRFDEAIVVTRQLRAFYEREGNTARVEEQDRLIERYRRRERWAP